MEQIARRNYAVSYSVELKKIKLDHHLRDNMGFIYAVKTSFPSIWRHDIFLSDIMLTSQVQVQSPNVFLLLARYVPNVAKRSIWDQCKKKYILRTDRRPMTDQRPHIWEISNGHISARGRPIHLMFGSTLGFSRSADRMALIPVWPNSIGIWEEAMRDE